MIEILLTALLMVVLLLLKGFFSGSEIAFVSADRIRLRHRATQGEAGPKLALRLLSNPTKLLTTTLLGTNISSIALTTVGAFLMIGLFGANGELVALLLFTPIFLILGEIVPKSVYQQKADALVPYIAYPFAWLRVILAPLIWVFSLIAGLAARLIGGKSDEAAAAREQFAATVSMVERTGAIEAFSRGQVRRVLRFAQMTAAEAMFPISDIACAPRAAPMADLVRIRRDTGQRLIPLYEAAAGDVTAAVILESWDILDPDIEIRDVDRFLRPLHFAPQLQRVSEVFELLHGAPNTVVVVVDEYGSGVGLITLNTLVRRTLGAETSPATDREAPEAARRVERRPDGAYLIDARLAVGRVNEALETTFPIDGHASIGGLALSRFGRMPQVGESFEAEGYAFEIVDASPRAILALSARKTGPAA